MYSDVPKFLVHMVLDYLENFDVCNLRSTHVRRAKLLVSGCRKYICDLANF